jgi:hypothetical protein
MLPRGIAVGGQDLFHASFDFDLAPCCDH